MSGAPLRVAIVGVGAIGGWIGARLAAAGNPVSAYARGATLEALHAHGFRLDDGGEAIVAPVVAASDRASELGPQDVVVLAVKGPALAGVADAVADLTGPDTTVLTAMNGVPWWFLHGAAGDLDRPLAAIDPAGAIGRAIPARAVIGSVVHASCVTPEPGRVVRKMGNGLILGEPAGGDSDRLERIAGAFRDARFDVTVSPHIQQAIWYKLWGNMTMNPISALTGATCDRILDDPLVRGFTQQVMAEAKAIGARIGCPIEESGEDRIAVTRKLGAFKTSMLQDVEAGRALEIDALLSAPREIAQRVGVETPAMDALLGLTRLMATTRDLYHA